MITQCHFKHECNCHEIQEKDIQYHLSQNSDQNLGFGYIEYSAKNPQYIKVQEILQSRPIFSGFIKVTKKKNSKIKIMSCCARSNSKYA